MQNRHMEHLLEFGVCFTNHAHIYYPQSLTNAGGFGQGNSDLVREMSGNFAFYLWEPCLGSCLWCFVTFTCGILGQVWYLEIISWRFGYRPKYQPETPLSAREL